MSSSAKLIVTQYTLQSTLYTEWQRLAQALSYLEPKSFQDEVFRQSMLNYCQKNPQKRLGVIQTTHSPERFGMLLKGLQASRRTNSCTFFDVVQAEAKRQIAFYQKKSLILSAIQTCQGIHVDKIRQIFWLIPEFLNYFTVSLPDNDQHQPWLMLLELNKSDLKDFLRKKPDYFQLDFRHFGFTVKTARTLAYSFMHCQLGAIILDGQPFEQYKALKTDESRHVLDYFLRAMPYYKGLTVLRMNHTELNDQNFMRLIDSVSLLPELAQLELSNNFITNQGMQQLNAFMHKRRLRRVFKGLRNLDLSHNLITLEGAEALFQCVEKFPALETVEWGENNAVISSKWKEAFHQKLQAMQDRKMQKQGDLARGSLMSERPSSLYDVASQRQPSILRNSLPESCSTTTTTRESVYSTYTASTAYGRSTSSKRSLFSVRSRPQENASQLSGVISHALNIKKEEEQAQLTDEEKKYWSDYVHEGVLDFSVNVKAFDEHATTTLISCLQQADENALREVNFTKQKFKLSDFRQILTALTRFKTLKSLNLREISVVSDGVVPQSSALLKIQVVTNLLPQFPSLTELNLLKDGFSEADIQNLLDSIQICPSLQSIQLQKTDENREPFKKIQTLLQQRTMPMPSSLSIPSVDLPQEYQMFQVKSDPVPDIPEKYHLIPLYTDEIAVRWSPEKSLHDHLDEIVLYFFNPLFYPHRYDYYTQLSAELYAMVMARLTLSTGLLSSSEQGQLSTYAGVAAAATTTAFPITIPITLTAMDLIYRVDSIERQAFNQQIASLLRYHRAEHIQPLLSIIALLVSLKHIDNCQEYGLFSSEQRKKDVDNIMNFLGYYNSAFDPISLEMNPIKTLMLRKISRLMQLCFDETHCVLPMRWQDWEQCQTVLDEGIHIISPQKQQELPMSHFFLFPCSHDVYKDMHLNEKLREEEHAFRGFLIHMAQSYLKKWHECGFYQRYFIQYIRCHGGQDVLTCCKKLEKMAKTLPYYDLITAFKHFLHQLEKVSGWRDESFQTPLIEALAPPESPDYYLKRAQEKYYLWAMFFPQKTARQQKKQAILDRYEEALSESRPITLIGR